MRVRDSGRWFVWVMLLGGSGPLSSCSSDDVGQASPCVDGDERCGQACSNNDPCATGLFCSTESKCSKQCGQLLGQGCNDGMQCGGDGRCTEPGTGMSSTGEPTAGGGAGTFGNSDGGPGDLAGVGAAGTTARPPNVCASTRVNATRVTPTVILIIDQSSSMDSDFQGGTTRWDTLRDFLLAQPDGLIASLQDQVNFGLAMYSAESGGTAPDPIGECPQVTMVAPGPDNFAAIEAVYSPANTIEDTPTGDSIDKIIDDLGLATLDPDAQGDPIVFILATDGEPDRCEELDPQNGQAEAIAAVERAFSLGIRTFIISVGDEVSAQHQQDVANAGLGRGPGDENAQYWEAGNDASLRAALTEIVGGQIGCEVQLNGSVEGGDPCLGSVMLNGVLLGCNDPNGWELTSPRTIRLNGGACDTLKNDSAALLEVTFPCEVKVVD